jgi:hypothetical protein
MTSLITRESTTTDMIMGRGAYDTTGTPKPKPPPKKHRIGISSTFPDLEHMDNPAMGSSHPSQTAPLAFLGAPMQAEHIEDVQQQRIPQQRGYPMQRTGHHVRLTDHYAPLVPTPSGIASVSVRGFLIWRPMAIG